ncbi:Hypothetical predicted protein, partial [Pelobates cultripes]
MAKDATKALLWTKQLYYDKANKADTLLARNFKQRHKNKQIHKITTPGGEITEDPDRIAKVFQNYFGTLHDHSPETRQYPALAKTLIDQYLTQ